MNCAMKSRETSRRGAGHFPTASATLQFELHLSLPYNQPVPGNHEAAIDATTRYCAVYGHPVRHSASPSMQNAGMAALGLNWRYLAFEVPPDQLQSAIAGT